MLDGLVFGWRSAVLSIAFVQLLLLAAALTRPIRNRVANRTLAVLLVVLAGMITPWMIGFAGFYDKWQWLSFAPLAISLAVAPLAWLYIHALIHGRWPTHGWRHLVPATIQFSYLAAAFVLLRQPFKNEWLAQSSLAYDAITGGGVVAGLAAYGLAARSLIRLYRERLSGQRSDDHRFALSWLARAVGALFALLAVWAVYGMYDLIQPLGYRGLMGLYLAIATFALFLGIEGWRHAALPFPHLAELELPPAPTVDWVAKAEAWAGRVRSERLYADPELSVPRLARALGTNSAYVSRAFNEGLGHNFSGFINGLRCEEVAARLRDGTGDDLLDVALECGFSSKASFNRAFLATYGCSPSSYRRAHGSNRK
ncbi:helix-turn-helix domain-containing protein [Sphingomonas sp. SUN039]|uniref:AraC family transcriptional regulator n=1 Tax=Sphingomonas sp. SUN039 TaxID=2937787 RepID=UPI002164E409|nr:helix-turn-helix domain-containing protein [Sphingomonas sp. SUN039]UVO53134.1 helix-turn-helix domain-containing protein [Sphingomonas sp. SUN039]